MTQEATTPGKRFGLPTEAEETVLRSLGYMMDARSRNIFLRNVARWKATGETPKGGVWTSGQQLWWFIHHEIPLEFTEDIQERVNSITGAKGYGRKNGLINRFKAMRPVKNPDSPLIQKLVKSGRIATAGNAPTTLGLRAEDVIELRKQFIEEYPGAASALYEDTFAVNAEESDDDVDQEIIDVAKAELMAAAHEDLMDWAEFDYDLY